jgi:hypothetical protein
MVTIFELLCCVVEDDAWNDGGRAGLQGAAGGQGWNEWFRMWREKKIGAKSMT